MIAYFEHPFLSSGVNENVGPINVSNSINETSVAPISSADRAQRRTNP